MAAEEKLAEQTIALLRKRGQKAIAISKQSILEERINYKPLREALCYFIDEVFCDVFQPGLLSLYCEAVGGDPHATIRTGAAMVLLVGAADIHDDIIDQSTTKNAKPTVFGKYGQEIAVLAGDALLIKGMLLLHEAIEPLPENKRKTILELIKKAFFDLSSVEAEEATLRGKMDLSEQEYLRIIEKKKAVSEATAKIGAILGGGEDCEIKALGEYGRMLSLVMTMRDEFIDIFEPDELANRFTKECLPLPILNVFNNSKEKDAIIHLLKGGKISRGKTEKIVEIVMNSKETIKLKKKMRLWIRKGIDETANLKGNKETLQQLLMSTLEDL